MSEPRRVSVTGLSILTALGRGPGAQLAGTAAFSEVQRFDTSNRRVHHAATAADVGTLEEELDLAIATACSEAGVDRSTTPLLLALHTAPSCDFGQQRVYTSACVSASTAVADAATLIRNGRADRIVVAAAYLVEPDQYALFDAARALSDDHAVRPFSLNRRGLLLGDGVAAVVLQAGEGLAEIAGWARTGDAYHPCQPAPDGRGLAAAIRAALTKANLRPEAIGYINANATGTQFSDAAEAAAISQVFTQPNPQSQGSTPEPGGSAPGFSVRNPQPQGSAPEVGSLLGVRVGDPHSQGSAPEVGGSAPGFWVRNPQAQGSAPEGGALLGVRVGDPHSQGSTPEVGGSAPGFWVRNPQAQGSAPEGVGSPVGGRVGDLRGRVGDPRSRVGDLRGRVGDLRGRGATREGGGVAVSSSKGVHGHALEASGLVELVVTVQALREGKLPVNAGFSAPDPDCPLDLILDVPRPAWSPYGMTLNSAFGGANTALVVCAP